MKQKPAGSRASSPMTPRKIGGKDGILGEEQFQQMVRLERKRAQRSGKPFLMVHLDMTRYLAQSPDEKARRKMLAALTSATRDTDILGWSKSEKVIGVMFIELRPCWCGSVMFCEMFWRSSSSVGWTFRFSASPRRRTSSLYPN